MLIAIIIFFILGIILTIIEIVIIPGSTVAGVGALIMFAFGIYFSYSTYGTQIGNYVLVGTILFLIIAIVFALRANTWKKFMLNTNVDGVANTIETDIKIGDTGITVARLNPMGKVLVNNEYYEAKTINEMIDPDTEIIVVKITGNTLIVKSLNK
ncbi:MAG: hypothetical protein COS14_09035 [Bacteroidetes bacterium CG02_land_8_20_14_3_00_31_25]|nr:hypothetical protein [Bacteroidota bacterium]PIV58548.1 MAG: hypothetical protein COS14_09035 [Bacteroidetes bacterium CG02_land_8_20_14_3_00_31_25]PIX36627.1 MAG: hypothetical protein COZ59_00045 [Bacteroidetes bacterium CG_4_8_14_3_um_filter_31_14]PIY04371.1 MAG: hypothetical protein COZ21_06885 [Bacteroidetes bacterium CG_4_10_14_3_um_filter_31_20]